MISGNFGDEDELFFEIELIAANSFALPVEALFDTGFSWWLAINNANCYQLINTSILAQCQIASLRCLRFSRCDRGYFFKTVRA